MNNSFSAFIDELEKIADRLTKSEQRERDVKFTALGTASGPVIAGLSGAIKGGHGSLGKNITQGARVSRWLPATMGTGFLVSGAIPAIRHQIERDIIADARDRRTQERKAKSLVSGN